MTIHSKLSPTGTATAASPFTLADVLTALATRQDLSAVRRRDLISAVKRIAALIGEEPAGIPLDLVALRRRLEQVNPVAAGISIKSYANIRSAFLAALKASGLKRTQGAGKGQLAPTWAELLGGLPSKRTRWGLSRLARYAGALGVDPAGIDDAVITTFITAMRVGSLHPKVNDLHRKTAVIWNEVVGSRAGLNLVSVPSFRQAPKRIEWESLPGSLRQDVEDYLTWCAGADVFDANARYRALAPATLRLRRDQIRAGITALVERGTPGTEIKTLADVVRPDAFRRILKQRHKMVEGRENTFNRDLAEALAQVAREWVKAEPAALIELKGLTSKVPVPKEVFTEKNKQALRQFNDPAVFERLHDLPERLWAEVKRSKNPNFRTLAKAQTALAIAILSFMPVRLENLAVLEFSIHVFLQEGRNAISTLDLSAFEVKNESDLGFDIPPDLAQKLMEYRDKIAPKVVGRRPDRLFVRPDGKPKSPATVAWLITTALKKRAGIVMTVHQFRHLCAKIMLDDNPGCFELVKQLLGHKNLATTIKFYTGIDQRRAARHHHALIEKKLASTRGPRGAAPRRPRVKGK